MVRERVAKLVETELFKSTRLVTTWSGRTLDYLCFFVETASSLFAFSLSILFRSILTKVETLDPKYG